MRLESSDGHVEEIDHQAIFCPTSPYNLAPPQLLVRSLKKRGYQAQGYHDDTEYVLRYSRPNSASHKMRTPISPNDLFLAQLNPGYTSFFHEAVTFAPLRSSLARFDTSEGGLLPATEGDPQLQRLQKKQMRLATLHEKLGHTSFDILNRLAQAGLVPRDLAGVQPPKCPGCQYGKAHWKPWRLKGWRNSNRKLKPANRPGEVDE